MELSTCRQIGFGAGPIPWYAVRAYVDYHNLGHDTAADLFYLVRVMDDAYLEYVAALSKG